VETDERGCLSEPAFREAIRQRLTFDPFVDAPETIRLTARIERYDRGLRATVTLTDGASDATQEIRAQRGECATLSAAAALAASMTIERALSHVLERSAPEARPDPLGAAPPVATEDLRPPHPKPAARATRRSPPRFDVRTHAALLGGLGILPETTGGLSLGTSLKLERWGGGIEAGAWLPAVAVSPLGGGARARLVHLSGTACRWHRLLFVCAVATLGELRAAGTGPLVSRSSGSTYIAAGGRVGLELPVSEPFSVAFHVGAVVPLVRSSLRIADETLWRAPPMGVELGVSWQITIF
jgi:hypothetical protein